MGNCLPIARLAFDRLLHFRAPPPASQLQVATTAAAATLIATAASATTAAAADATAAEAEAATGAAEATPAAAAAAGTTATEAEARTASAQATKAAAAAGKAAAPDAEATTAAAGTISAPAARGTTSAAAKAAKTALATAAKTVVKVATVGEAATAAGAATTAAVFVARALVRAADYRSLTARVLSRDTQELAEDFHELFEIGAELGQGQYGTTYECVQRSSGKKFACKVIQKSKLLNDQDVAYVRQEIEIMHHVSDYPDQVVKIHDAYEDTFGVYIVMDLCSGGELFHRIAERGHYSEREAARIMKTIVSIVRTCHSLSIMHRDLKPENFLFSNEEEDSPLKAIDFGWSVFFQPGQVFTERAGTAPYVAPEVVNQSYGPAADIWSTGIILYLLLCGFLPFEAVSVSGTFKEVVNGELDLITDPWPQISPCAKELISNILNRNPAKRLTAQDILCHPWICQDGVAPDRPLDPAVLSRMKQYTAMNKMKKIALRHIAKKLKEEEIAGLKKSFMAMDIHGKGAITFDDLKAGLERLGSPLDDDTVRDIMEGVDMSKSGSIDIDDFVTATLHSCKRLNEEDLVTAFALFDKNGRGVITKNELLQTCLEHAMSDAEVQHILKELDQNDDGSIDYGEFVAMMSKGNSGLRPFY